MSTTYTTVGSVRGGCGHMHRTVQTAVACMAADERACARQRGYSDRVVVRSDRSELTDREHYDICDALDAARDRS